MFFSVVLYSIIVLFRFLPWGGFFLSLLIDLSFQTLENLVKKFLKFVKSPLLARTPPPPPRGIYIDRCILRMQRCDEVPALNSKLQLIHSVNSYLFSV